MVLQIPIATEYFYEYLDQFSTDEELYYFSLYADIVKFDRAVSKGYESDQLYQLAQGIRQDYLD